nr:NAD(P)-dependent oxidoreductase [Pseudomonas aeruginosa]
MDTLQNMRAFVCVAETGSFTAASQQLNTTTAYVSRAVANLETHLRTRLLNRTTRRIALTEAGQRYLLRCEQILAYVEEAEAEASDAHARPAGKLKLHSMTGIGQHYVIRAIAGYRQQYRDVTFDLTMANRVPDLLDEGFDVAIVVASELPDSGFISQRIGETYSILCASPEYLRLNGTPSEPSELASHDCLRLVSPVVPLDRWLFDGPNGQEMVSIGASPFQVNVGDAMTEAIRSGLGIGILPVYSAIEDLGKGTLVRVLPQHRLQQLNVYALYPSRQYLDAKIKTWVEYLKESLPGLLRLAPEHLERLQRQFNVRVLEPKQGDIDAQYAAALPDTHGMIGVGRPLGARQLEQAKQLEVISSVSVGYDNYDLDYLNRRGIALTNTPDVLTETTADLGFALLISAARRVAELDAWVKAGNWKRTVDAPQFGTDVHGKKLGILGLGRIGAAIARRGRFGFGMQVLYHGNNRKPELEQELGARFLGFDELLGEADFVCVVVPLGAQTRRLIGARELGLMKPSAILVNVARGQVVDEAALVAALREKRILGAGLDVYEKEPLAESPLFALDNVVTLPHIGSATHETRRAMAERALQNFEAALRGERPLDLVNPQVWRRG